MSGAEHIERVKRCRCVICLHRFGRNTTPCDAHHVGTGEDRDDFATASLCKEHHQGATGVHGLHRRAFERMWKATDILLLAWTNRELARLDA
ncbi:MAG: hypothetical protein A3E01_08385 [Gammaproteobacteria bacterium RIFCSPHIGHO2_12_FULL_63_22]|nr:MAG: hypothetical protein A3E01_08385 [Gammaproteobacteria bacterium RIFCSPHIGHO2_12_FULL_63_22]